MPAFSLPRAPPTVTSRLHRTQDAPLPTHTPNAPEGRRLACECHSFGGALEPRYIVGAKPLDQ